MSPMILMSAVLNVSNVEFQVKVGIQHGSVLSLLLFTIVQMHNSTLSEQFTQGLPWELFYSDDLELIAEW